MANFPPLPQNLTRADLQKLKEACERFFPVELLGEDHAGSRITSRNIPELRGKLPRSAWKNNSEFLNDVLVLTAQTNIKYAYGVLDGWEKQFSETAEAPEQPTRTTPPDLEKLVEESEQQKEKRKKDAEQRAKRKEARAAASKKQREEIKKALKEKIVYAEPKEPSPKTQPSPQEEYAIKKLADSAVSNRRSFVGKLSKQIVDNASPQTRNIIPPEQLELSAKQIALDFSDRLVNKTPVAPPGVFSSIADPATDLEKIVASPAAVRQIRNAGATFSAVSEASDFATRTLLSPVLGPNVTDYFYGSPSVDYKITFEPTENTAFTVNLPELHDSAVRFQSGPVYQSMNNPLLDAAKNEVVSFGKDTLISQLNKLPKDGALGFISKISSSGSFDGAMSLLAGSQTQYVATNALGKFVTTFLPQYTEIIGGVANFLKLNVGLAPVVAGSVETVAVTVAVPAAEAVGVVVAETAAIAAAGTAATVAGGAVGAEAGATVGAVAGGGTPLSLLFAAIGAVIGAILPKLISAISKWLKKNKELATGIGAVVLVGGLLINSPLLIVGGAAGLVAGGLAAGSLAVGTIAGGVLLFGRNLGKSLVITIGLPIIITLAATPIVVYFILFIINSGAYLVPRSTSSMVPENPYVGVEKTASPTGPFENSGLPINITYTIAVKAKKGALTNIRINHVCEVITERGRSSCPSPLPSSPPTTVSPSSSYVFTYDVEYSGDEYKDSLVLNTFTVTADASEAKDQESGAAATIIIGDPPTGCFKLVGTNWPANFKSNLEGAIIKLVTNHPVFMAKACSRGEIGIAYDATPNSYWGWHVHGGEVDIKLYSGGLSNQLNAEYILTHETSHHLSRIMGSLYSSYAHCSACANERPICSYSATGEASEAFAEMNALYGSEKPLNHFAGCAGGASSFKDKYPAHWQFANDHVFR